MCGYISIRMCVYICVCIYINKYTYLLPYCPEKKHIPNTLRFNI